MVTTADEKVEMCNKIARTIRNCQNMTDEELRAVYDEAVKFKKTLPSDDRGQFGRESGLETLAMIAN